MANYKTIADSNNFIVLDKYKKFSELNEVPASYQTEADLEKELVKDLTNQGYEYVKSLTTPVAMLANVRVQLQNLNDMQFTDKEWAR
jgi:type I restriction enzyme R subunit